MAQYRISRNIEASIIEYLESELESGGWSNINVEKGFKNARMSDLPVVSVRLSDTIHEWVEIGGYSTVRMPMVLIDVFATSDGNRLDVKDFLFEKLKQGCPYYVYTIENGTITDRTQDGKIKVISIDDRPVNFDVDKSLLSEHDRYRHLLILNITLDKIEE